MSVAASTAMPLVGHLTELRNRLVKSLLAVGIGALAGFLFYPQLFAALIRPYCDIGAVTAVTGECTLYIRDPLGGFKLRFMIAGYAGLFLASPVVLWQVWRFITPGLYENEKRYAVPFVLSSVALFVTGAGLAFWTVPKAFEFLFSIGGPDLTPLLEPVAYLSFITFMMLVAVITPSGDPYSLLALSIPLFLFYEASIVVGRLIERHRPVASPISG